MGSKVLRIKISNLKVLKFKENLSQSDRSRTPIKKNRLSQKIACKNGDKPVWILTH